MLIRMVGIQLPAVQRNFFTADASGNYLDNSIKFDEMGRPTNSALTVWTNFTLLAMATGMALPWAVARAHIVVREYAIVGAWVVPAPYIHELVIALLKIQPGEAAMLI